MTVPGTVDQIRTELEVEHEGKGEYDQVEVELEWTVVPGATDDEQMSDDE